MVERLTRLDVIFEKRELELLEDWAKAMISSVTPTSTSCGTSPRRLA
jgi:hypothetical protein